MEIAADLLDRVLGLPSAERAELAHRLLQSLDDEEEKEPGHDEAWAAEIGRRIQAYDRGESIAIPWEEVRAMIRRDHQAEGRS